MVTLKELVLLLIECEQLPPGPEWEDERTTARLAVMEFLKRAQHPEPYIAHVHQLSRQHAEADRPSEAGRALLLHANIIGFTTDKLSAQPPFPAQRQCDRKETLYRQAIEFFSTAKEWEHAIHLLKELSHYYEHVGRNFGVLADLLQQQSHFFRLIATSERFPPAYFRVCFYGAGFPLSLQDKEFIYRGYECERITSFIGRMEKAFPKALILHDQEELGDAMAAEKKKQMFLVIHTVYASTLSAVANEEPTLQSNVPSYIAFHQAHSSVNVFFYSRPFRKRSKTQEDKENEFKVSQREVTVQSKANQRVCHRICSFGSIISSQRSSSHPSTPAQKW